MVEYSIGSWRNLMTAQIASIHFAILNPIELGKLQTLSAINLLGIEFIPQPFQTNIIIWEQFFKLLYSVFIHLAPPYLYTL